MADNKGILSSKEEKEIAKSLDAVFKFKHPVMEAGDGFVFRGVIIIVDDYGLEKINQDYKEDLIELKDLLFEKKWVEAGVIVFNLAAKIIKGKVSE